VLTIRAVISPGAAEHTRTSKEKEACVPDLRRLVLPSMTTTHPRLPVHVRPIDYDIEIEASPKRLAFSGTVRIKLRVAQATSQIELNARDLKVRTAFVTARRKQYKARVHPHPECESVTLEFASSLPPGTCMLEIAYTGRLAGNLHGLYLAKDGKQRAIVSQCEATDARAIFPCFDEPAFKASLRWTVKTDAGLTVITNGALSGVRKAGSKVVHSFQRTAPISSYLAALAIGDFEALKAQRVNGIPCRVLFAPGRSDQARFAEKITASVLPYYEKYFGQKYPFKKLDQVAVPGFDAGAMENVGAIFYRQQLLLMQENLTPWQAQKRIAEVIAHEISHMWFGNLVTMKWWDDLWLNEAFATWMAFKVIDHLRPDWRMWDDFADAQESALAADAMVNTHAIYAPVNNPAEASELFDVITYEKGCAVLRMAEHYLGEEVFCRGIRRYLTAHKFANATGADLWSALAEASGEPVNTLMRSWIEQAGFPLVTVVISEQEGRTIVHLSQQRFYQDAEHMQNPGDQTWSVPIVIRYDGGNGPETMRALLTEREQSVTLPTPSTVRWVYPNADGAGFYRLHFEDRALNDLLMRGLPMLKPAERAGLLTDQWALVQNGLSDIEAFMGVLTAFRGERDHVVTRALVAHLDALDAQLVADSHRPQFREFVRWLLADQLEELGYEPVPEEKPERSTRRATVLHGLGDLGRDPDVLRHARALATQENDHPELLEPNLARAVVLLAAIESDGRQLDHYVTSYQRRKYAGAPPELANRYLQALSFFEAAPAVRKVHAACKKGTVPQEQLRTVLAPMLARRPSQTLTWRFLKSSWHDVAPKIGAMGLARLVEALGALPFALYGDVEHFFAKNPVDSAQRALQKALEAMRLRHAMQQREQERLIEWLEAREADREV